MKTIKFLLICIIGLAFNFCGGVALGAVIDYPIAGGIATTIASFMPGAPAGAMRTGVVLTELFTGELIKKMRMDTSWISTISSRNEFVNNNTIHMVDVGADPEVLINNTTYPIPFAQRDDEDIAISLDKFETENTIVTRDELYALSYDKIGSVTEDHKAVLVEKEVTKAAHSLAPTTNTAETPIILTSGGTNGETHARKKMTPNDLIDAQKAMDDLNIPAENRVLVLCSAHVRDLLKVDETFAKQYKDASSGTVLDLYGFKFYRWNANPKYKAIMGVLTKKVWGAAAEADLDQDCSFFFYSPRAFQATGDTEIFYSEAAKDPQYRRNMLGYRQWHICLPKKRTGFGAIVSAIYHPES